MEIAIPVIIVAVIGLIAGVGLSLASKFMAVSTDEKQEKIRAALPGANCGSCGFSGCDGYAAAVAAGEAEPDKCAPGGEAAASAIAEILGVSVSTVPKIAFIACNGNRDITKEKYNYNGVMSCSAANMLHGGPLDCRYGCIGFGDCVRACPFGAIKYENGKPAVCADICVGCGNCTAVCPKSLISLIPKDHKTTVNCSNKEKGASVVKGCGVSCIACRMCEKACEQGAIKVVDNLATIDDSLCTNCGKCREVCKRGVLI